MQFISNVLGQRVPKSMFCTTYTHTHFILLWIDAIYARKLNNIQSQRLLFRCMRKVFVNHFHIWVSDFHSLPSSSLSFELFVWLGRKPQNPHAYLFAFNPSICLTNSKRYHFPFGFGFRATSSFPTQTERRLLVLASNFLISINYDNWWLLISTPPSSAAMTHWTFYARICMYALHRQKYLSLSVIHSSDSLRPKQTKHFLSFWSYFKLIKLKLIRYWALCAFILCQMCARGFVTV